MTIGLIFAILAPVTASRSIAHPAAAFRLIPGRPVEAELRRVAIVQLRTAHRAVTDRKASLDDRIHQARKRIKRLRGLLRLVRGAFPDFRAENRALRDAARLLSGLRDHTVRIDIAARLGTQLGADRIEPLLVQLAHRRDRAWRAPDTHDRLARFAEAMASARARVPAWRLDRPGFEALAPGLRATYSTARTAMATAKSAGTAVALHDWRKQVKYVWFHSHLAHHAAPDLIKPWERRADVLGDQLGDHHDLWILHATLPVAPLEADTKTALTRLIEHRLDELEQRAFADAGYLFAESPAAFVARLGRWWRLASSTS
ncbi:MAG: CHAD domain-containing protein [Rhodobacter sp.]|nr:CHAD domain-containing protein [Rhodobacter sp.]